ncbi:Arylsulfatase [Defluviimonas aquaemixtae]|uniref:Arylsulfatase n=1 Tax=Albidovulum aquaemixtae TaxID=1542388 RepID=A0A2R8B686_9RHOB|nr:sulfatase-like hydrolase/transferase [Defluviimonas aquaemixtae]SPH18129.1 Arylsulfatase [Defluviimonas aquaemixtae]
MAKRNNILFVIIDQLRADCLFGALSDHVDLPNLRALMDEAVSFRRHYSVANPCGPSRASILTGRYAMNHRSVRNGTPLAHDLPNLATEVRKAGYRPLLFGYTDTTQDPRVYPPGDPALKSYEQVMQGFEEAVEMRLEESLPWRADLIAKGYDVPPYPDIFRPAGDRPDDPALYRAEDSDTAFLTDAALKALRARAPGWFVHLTYIRPHPPLVAPDPYNRMYDPATLPLPRRIGAVEAERARHPFVGPSLDRVPIASVVEGFPDLSSTDENVQLLRAIYLGLATEVDHHLGRVLDELKASGAYDETLIVVTSDHGEMLGDHHAWGKSTFYDAAYHTALIIRDPKRTARAGSAVDLPTESVDVAPTILDWLGLGIPETMDGMSLLPLMDGKGPDEWRQFTFSELDFGDPIEPTVPQSALGLAPETTNLVVLRGADHTLVHFNGGLPPLLFDNRAEGEMRDIAADPGARAALIAMYRAMMDHRMTHADGRFIRTMVTADGCLTAPRGAR